MAYPIARRLPMHHYVTLLTRGTPFSFSRWGDGEFNAMVGERGANCDKHEYFPEMGAELVAALRAGHNYYHGLLTCARQTGAERVTAVLDGIAVDWVDGDVMVEASLRGELNPLILALRQKRVAYVGPPHLRALDAFRICAFVEVPPKNCYLKKREIEAQVSALLMADAADVVGFSASMASKVFIDDLFPVFGAQVTMIDFGSMFDPYVGVLSRKYHRGIDWSAIIQTNVAKPVQRVAPRRREKERPVGSRRGARPRGG